MTYMAHAVLKMKSQWRASHITRLLADWDNLDSGEAITGVGSVVMVCLGPFRSFYFDRTVRSAVCKVFQS